MTKVNVKDSTRVAMKPRDRQVGSVAPGALATVSAEPTNGFLWEEWYHSATPTQQAELLALAGRQGLLYAQQIPAKANGTHAPPAPAGAEGSSAALIGDLLANRATLAPHAPPEIPDLAPELDPLQKQAICRALTTPDLCLIQGLPGTGKSRVVTEILVHAARQGLRVLFLAQHAAPIDTVLQRLSSRDGLVPIRLAAPGEVVPAALQPALLANRMIGFRTEALNKARLSRDSVESACRTRHSEESIWPALAALLDERDAMDARVLALRQKRDQVAAEVEQFASSFEGPFQSLAANHDSDLAVLRASLQEIHEKAQALRAQLTRDSDELGELEPIYQAKSQGKWWILAWWKATFQSKWLARKSEIDQQIQATQKALGELDAQRTQIDQRQLDLETQYQTRRGQLIQQEIERRQQLLLEEDAVFVQQLQALQTHWADLIARLEHALRPTEMTRDAVANANALWQGHRQKDEKNCHFAQQWVAFLEDAGERLSARLPALAGIVAGTVAAWTHEASAFPDTFDLLVVEEAEQLTEANLLPLAQKAKRWVLVANYQHPTPVQGAPANPREVRPAAARPMLFRRLWQLLHSDPSRLPYAWSSENERLLCQLRPVAPQDRGRLESECLADAPDIELRILTLARAEPALSQVLFPPGTTLARAKEFIYRELQEFAVQTCGRNGWLEEQPDHFVWHLLPSPPAATTPVQLETGLCEWLANNQTVRLEFARTCWTRDAVLAWVARHLRQTDLGRTAFLQVPHRMQASLAVCLGDILFPEPMIPAATCGPLIDVAFGRGCSVVFVPVPQVSAEQGKNPKLPRESSGTEIDLASARFSDRIPGDLIPGLPRQGFANYLEAQAVIRTLETLRASCPLPVAVVAFYAGQVELIRKLLARSTALAGCEVEVGLPAQFRDHERAITLVSLTRSNFHRTGSFASDPADALLALTRAQQQLILVGDPSTLIRWSQSLEPADSLDAGRERHWVRQLARYLQGTGTHQAAFYLCE